MTEIKVVVVPEKRKTQNDKRETLPIPRRQRCKFKP
jgi:hypothetical protein